MSELACLHIPDFSAWALACRWSSARSRPTGIVVSVGGQVHAFSASLSTTGLQVGDSLDRARSLAPAAEFHLRDTEIERAVWENLLCRMHRLTPRLQAVSPTGTAKSSSSARLSDTTVAVECGAWALMQAPDREALQQLSQELNAKVGLASHRPWAVLAAAYSEPGQLTKIPSTMTKPFLRQAHVSLLQCVGFSNDLVQRLVLFGIKAIQHVADLTERHLNSQFGTEGTQLFQFLHPGKEPPVPNYDPQVLDAEYDFDNPALEPAQLEPVVPHLIERLITLLQGKRARHIELCLKERSITPKAENHPQRGERRAGRILKDPTSQTERLCAAAQYLLRQTIADSHTGGIDTMSIILSGLTQPQSVQSDLFAVKPTLGPLFKNMDQQFPGRLLRPTFTHADPFFPEESYRFEPVCP